MKRKHSREPGRPPRPARERGVSSVEFAVVLPLFMMLFFFVLGLTIMAFSLLFAATGVPIELRAAAIDQSSPNLLAALETTTPAAGSISIGAAPGCERAMYAHLEADFPFEVPMLEAVRLYLKGGSVMRHWQFWPGPAADGCH